MLKNIFVNLNFVESSAGSNFFGVGIDGNVFLQIPHRFLSYGYDPISDTTQSWRTTFDSKNISSTNSSNSKTRDKGNETDDDKSLLSRGDKRENETETITNVHFPRNSGLRRPLEIVFSDKIPNMILLQAHRHVPLSLHNY